MTIFSVKRFLAKPEQGDKMNGNQSAQVAVDSRPQSTPLCLDIEEVRKEASLPAVIRDDSIENRAREMARSLVAVQADSHVQLEDARKAVEEMGRPLQRESAKRSAMLQQPIKSLARSGEDGGQVAGSLIDLKMKVEELDPARFDFSPGWISRTLGFLPVVGSPIKRYFTQFESSQTVISAIISSLEKGRDQLKRDNITLGEDQRIMRELTISLQKQISFGEQLDSQLQYILEREITADDPKKSFIEQELLFPLRQRIMDLQTQLAVNQQGVLAIGVILQNNRELIRGVNRAIDVTVSALQVGVVVALALANQKIVLDKISALNRTTTDLIAGTAERLRTQGVEIHKQASSSTLDVETLKKAFGDISAAIDDIGKYRHDALPRMAQTILEFDRLCASADEKIRTIEDGEKARPGLSLDID